MEIFKSNKRTIEAAHRRLIVEEEKRLKYDKLLQDKENREKKVAENRKLQIQRKKEKAEIKNQRVQTVFVEKKEAEKDDSSEDYRCCRSSLYGSHGSLTSTSFHHLLPCSVHQGSYGDDDSRRYSLNTSSAQRIKSFMASKSTPASTSSTSSTESSPSNTKSIADRQKMFQPLTSTTSISKNSPSSIKKLEQSFRNSPPKTKSIADLQKLFEPTTTHLATKKSPSSIRKLAKSIRNAAIKPKHSKSPAFVQPETTVIQSTEDMMDEIYQLDMDIKKRDETVTHLEDYIDNVLCRIIEECPHLLQTD